MAEDGAAPRDLEAVRAELKADIHRVELGLADFRTDMAKELGQVRAEMGTVRTEVTGLLGQLGSRLTAVETTGQHTQAAMHDLRQELRGEMQELRGELQELRGEMRQFRLTMTRQMWTMITVVTGAIVVGLVKLVFFPGSGP